MSIFVLNACDAEKAIGLARTDLFSARDNSTTVACNLGHWVAEPEAE